MLRARIRQRKPIERVLRARPASTVLDLANTLKFRGFPKIPQGFTFVVWVDQDQDKLT